ncbi:unnamed protein product [Medioppia subpectinata]|uniref:Protein hunchback n=2 Tax=Medioppia subpectinata TaxID=1979941 RepID=A0A7R9KNA8_9ACAR|nr:unnamed protein product [Medioppia subpectinata]CAG2106675.1 unnamed protein product [Medioppia subpectinata]
MNTHFDHKCAFCDYTSRTEGRLKRHIRDFHSEIPPDSWAGNRVLKESSELDGDDSIDGTDASVNGSGGNSKSRKYKCKQCEFVATCKQEFWGHSKAHIKSEKLLSCTKCSFVTEYKHHLEYHLRNHFGSKPFKCAKCNYSCVNKSMLNSHMKSHSNIYQYRCADCSYATKYCHSLKLHLRKYQHKPATVLNLDGTPNPYPVIDVYGTRRGPRPKKSKPNKNSQNQQKSQHLDSSLSTPMISSPLSPNLLNITPVPPLIPASMPMTLPFIYPPNSSLLHSGLLGQQSMSQIHRLNSLPHSLYESVGAQNMSNSPNSSSRSQTQSPSHMNNKLKCNFCEFCTETREVFGKHLLAHVAAENQDVCRIYGMTPSAEMVQQNAIISELAARQSPDSRCLLEQIAVNPSLINTLLAMHSQPKAHHLTLDWHSAQDSPGVDISPQSISTNNESRYLARPESVPIGANIKGVLSPLIPRSKSSPTNTHESVEKHNNQTNTMSRQLPSDTTPLDLSSNKSTSPLIQAMDSKNTVFAEQLPQSSLVSYPLNKQTDEHNMSICVPSSGAPPQPPPPPPSESQSERQQSRAQRRKGRASKLNVNRCTKIISQSLKNDELSEDLCEETGDSVVEDMEPDVDHIISKINNATSLLQEILIDMYSLKNDAYH